MAIDWSLLGPPVDVGAKFKEGYDLGIAKKREAGRQHALAAYVADPTNPDSQNALASYDEGFAVNLAGQRAGAAEKQRIGRILTSGDLDHARFEALAGGDIELAKQIASMSKDQHDHMSGMYKAAAPVAYQALKLPYEQRKQYIASVTPELKAAGWTDDLLANFDPTDEALTGVVHSAMSLDQAMGRDKINYEVVPAGAKLQGFDSSGRPLGDAGAVSTTEPTTDAPHPQAEGVGNVLSSGGLPAPVVAGFLGNFHVEGGYGGAKGDGGSAAGIAQLRGERQANFQRVIGKPVGDATPEEQARFTLWEMQNPEAAGMTVEQRDAIMAAKTPEEAAALIDQFYERSSGQHRDRRVAAAKMYGQGGKSDETTIRQQAQAAIAAGADPAKVKARAAEMGVTL